MRLRDIFVHFDRISSIEVCCGFPNIRAIKPFSGGRKKKDLSIRVNKSRSSVKLNDAIKRDKTRDCFC